MARPSFEIDTKDLPPEKISAQLRAIKDIPCVIRIYDRILVIDSAVEIWALCSGIEIGYYLQDEHKEINK